MIGVEMGVLIGIFSMTVAEDMLGDGGAGHAVEMCCGGMPEKMSMEMFINTAIVRDPAKDILEGSRRYPFSPF